MKTKKYLQVLIVLCVLALVSGFANNKEPLGNINNITVSHGKPNTKIILDADSPLSHIRSSYAQDRPSTIIIDFDRVDTSAEPQLASYNSPLIKNISTEKIDSHTLRLLVDLKERVPFRIAQDDTSTVVELNHVQKQPGEYILDPEVEKMLSQPSQKSGYLTGIHVSKKERGVAVKAILSQEPVYNVFVLDNPMRLVVDLYNTFFSSSQSTQTINQIGIKRVRAAQFQIDNPFTITRMVFDLQEPKFYMIKSSDNNLTVSFFKEEPVRVTPTATKPEDNTPPAQPKSPSPKNTTAEPENEARSIITPAKAKAPPPAPKKSQPKELPAEEIIKLPNELKPENNGSIPKEVQEEQFTPRTLTEPESKYSGEVITLKFKDADLRDVITYLGEFAGLNVAFDPEVRGVVSCNLIDVPWDQALDLLLKQNKMGRTLEGNILRIAPVQTLTQEREQQLRLEESKELAGPRLTKSFTLSYSKAGDVEALLQNKLSERGEMIVDGRTNTLIVTDVRDRIEILERLIDVFDTPTPQVSIEARIVEATSTFIRNLGIQWGFRGISDPFYGNQTSLEFPHKVLIDGALIPQGIVTKGIGGPLGGYAVNLPAPAFSTAMGVSFANILDTFRLDMAISALETSGNGRIISSPSVTTQNNQEAEIIQGRQIPVQTVANFTVTTRYINAALELRATPQITAEGTIIMYLELRNNAADFANLVNGIPPIITQSARTTVMIPDGGTTVIGGIYRTEDSITRERVPFFHKIPILGNLFRSFARTKQSRELLIFISPRIIK
jgi:type IV pilus assembly protein PilQ